MTTTYPTPEAAASALIAREMAKPDFDGVTIFACVGSDLCGKVDPTPEEQNQCKRCTVTIIGPGGRA